MLMPRESELARQNQPPGGRSHVKVSRNSRWAEKLLNSCAEAIANNNILRIQHLMWVLNDLASETGDPNQRLAAHGLRSLFCRVMGTTNPPPFHDVPRPVHGALMCFHDASPWYQIIYTIANEAMLEACEARKSIHVLDIGICHGMQWPTFIEALATQPSGSPSRLKITVVAESPKPLGFLNSLKSFAASMELKLDLNTTILPSLPSLQNEGVILRMLQNRHKDEVLLISAQFRLHQLQDEPDKDGRASPRDAFLKFLHDLSPNLLVLSENDVDQSSPEFVRRFRDAADFHWRFLDSTSAAFKGRESEERQVMEKEAGMAFHNVVACEGEMRVERNEHHESWKRRMERAGFRGRKVEETVVENGRSLLRKYGSDWDISEHQMCVVLQWKKQPTTFTSLWTPH